MHPVRAEIILKGHLLNPLWKSRESRRRTRGLVTAEAVSRYLDRYVPFIKGLEPSEREVTEGEECIFSLWLQGADNAPEVVRSCWESVRRNCRQQIVILDEESLGSRIELPDHITRKWKDGTLRPAHYADICRLALLVRYGGLWLDATDYIAAPFPSWLWDADFFVHMSGTHIRGWYSYVQNCFIRARKGNFLASAWLELILEYWRREDVAADYFIHQLLFKKLVECNPYASAAFGKMPCVLQDAAHELWFGHGDDDFDPARWEEMASSALFQKTEYSSSMARSPRPGSVAEHLLESGSK